MNLFKSRTTWGKHNTHTKKQPQVHKLSRYVNPNLEGNIRLAPAKKKTNTCPCRTPVRAAKLVTCPFRKGS